jgi:hypothetical protein
MGSAEGGAVGSAFHPARRGSGRATYSSERSVPGADVARLDAEEWRALAAVERVGGTINAAFTQATSMLYRLCVLLALAVLLLTLFMPVLPLRRTHGPTPLPAE